MELVEKMNATDLADPNFKLVAPTRHHIVDWVLEGYNYLLTKKDMIKRGSKFAE